MRRCRRCGHRNYGGGSDGGILFVVGIIICVAIGIHQLFGGGDDMEKLMNVLMVLLIIYIIVFLMNWDSRPYRGEGCVHKVQGTCTEITKCQEEII